jgi:hypothetical protein
MSDRLFGLSGEVGETYRWENAALRSSARRGALVDELLLTVNDVVDCSLSVCVDLSKLLMLTRMAVKAGHAEGVDVAAMRRALERGWAVVRQVEPIAAVATIATITTAIVPASIVARARSRAGAAVTRITTIATVATIATAIVPATISTTIAPATIVAGARS